MELLIKSNLSRLTACGRRIKSLRLSLPSDVGVVSLTSVVVSFNVVGLKSAISSLRSKIVSALFAVWRTDKLGRSSDRRACDNRDFRWPINSTIFSDSVFFFCQKNKNLIFMSFCRKCLICTFLAGLAKLKFLIGLFPRFFGGVLEVLNFCFENFTFFHKF